MNKDGDIKNYINNLQENEISQIYNLPDEKLKQYKIQLKQLIEYFNFKLELNSGLSAPDYKMKNIDEIYLIDKTWFKKWKKHVGYKEIKKFYNSFRKPNKLSKSDYEWIETYIINNKSKQFLNPLDNKNIYNNKKKFELEIYSEFAIVNKKCFNLFSFGNKNFNINLIKSYKMIKYIDKLVLLINNKTSLLKFKEKETNKNFELLINFLKNNENHDELYKKLADIDANIWIKRYKFNLFSTQEMEIKDLNIHLVNKTLFCKKIKGLHFEKEDNLNKEILNVSYAFPEDLKKVLISEKLNLDIKNRQNLQTALIKNHNKIINTYDNIINNENLEKTIINRNKSKIFIPNTSIIKRKNLIENNVDNNYLSQTRLKVDFKKIISNDPINEFKYIHYKDDFPEKKYENNQQTKNNINTININIINNNFNNFSNSNNIFNDINNFNPCNNMINNMNNKSNTNNISYFSENNNFYQKNQNNFFNNDLIINNFNNNLNNNNNFNDKSNFNIINNDIINNNFNDFNNNSCPNINNQIFPFDSDMNNNINGFNNMNNNMEMFSNMNNMNEFNNMKNINGFNDMNNMNGLNNMNNTDGFNMNNNINFMNNNMNMNFDLSNMNMIQNMTDNNMFNKINNIFDNFGFSGINNNLNPRTSQLLTKMISLSHKIGLQNIGQTCYMNASLQCLTNIQSLSEQLLQMHSQNQINIQQHPLTFAYANLLLEFKTTYQSYIIPNTFKSCVELLNPLFKGNQAADAKDFIFFIIERLHQELKPPDVPLNNFSQIDFMKQEIEARNEELTREKFLNELNQKNTSIISKIFHGITRSIMRCDGCGNQKYSFQTFNILNFILKKVKEDKQNQLGEFLPHDYKLNLLDAFDSENKYEKLEGENMIYCNNCKSLKCGSIKQDIYKLPPILIIVLNRGKNNQDFREEFIFNEILDLQNLNNIVYNPQTFRKYFLCGVITHLGESGSNGHFISYFRNSRQQNFLCYNDASVAEVGIQDAMKSKISFREDEDVIPYILFYHYFRD